MKGFADAVFVFGRFPLFSFIKIILYHSALNLCKKEQMKDISEDMMIKTIKSDWYFIIPASITFFSALIITWWDFVKIQEMSYHTNLINITGLLLFVIGVAIRRIGKRTLGKYYAYGLRTLQNHKLITHGVYKHVRHPISLAMFMYGIGIPLIFTSFYGVLIMLMLVPLTLYRIRIEEKMLIEKFGDNYKDYMTRTKKLIPFIY